MKLVIILIMAVLVIALIRLLSSTDKSQETRRLENKQQDNDVIEHARVDRTDDEL